METTRTFLSLNLDDVSLLSAADVQLSLKGSFSGIPVKWEDPKKLHLTLRFLGDIATENLGKLVGVLQRLKFDFDRITFSAADIGFFPNPKYPNVVFLGLEEIGDNSAQLICFIDKIVYNFGVKPDKKFVPHITLGRFRRDKRVKLTEKINVDFDRFNVEFLSFNLMKSELNPGGSVHTLIKEINFSN